VDRLSTTRTLYRPGVVGRGKRIFRQQAIPWCTTHDSKQSGGDPWCQFVDNIWAEADVIEPCAISDGDSPGHRWWVDD